MINHITNFRSNVAPHRQRVELLLGSLESGSEISDEEFKALLTKEELREYNHKLRHPEPRVPPWLKEELSCYLERVQEGDRCFNRAERLAKKHWEQHKILHKKAEAFYEQALERLASDINDHSVILGWLDRNPSDGFGAMPDIGGVPRLINSMSPYNQARKYRDKKAKIQAMILKGILLDMGEEA